MKCQADIEALADAKFNEARCLLGAGLNDGAFYLAGYTIELLLKAKVCKTLGITDFFLFDKAKNKDAYRPYKVHDYDQLLLLSGIFSEFQSELTINLAFKKHWSVVSKWDEGARYLAGRSNTDAQNFVSSVHEVSLWIKKHL